MISFLDKLSSTEIACQNTIKVKEKFVTLQSIGIIAIEVEKQGQSSTPAGIPVDNLIPNSVH